MESEVSFSQHRSKFKLENTGGSFILFYVRPANTSVFGACGKVDTSSGCRWCAVAMNGLTLNIFSEFFDAFAKERLSHAGLHAKAAVSVCWQSLMSGAFFQFVRSGDKVRSLVPLTNRCIDGFGICQTRRRLFLHAPPSVVVFLPACGHALPFPSETLFCSIKKSRPQQPRTNKPICFFVGAELFDSRACV